MTVVHHAVPPPPALISARQALHGLAALLNTTDPQAWASMARPPALQLAHLVWAIGGKLDEGLTEAGFAPPD